MLSCFFHSVIAVLSPTVILPPIVILSEAKDLESLRTLLLVEYHPTLNCHPAPNCHPERSEGSQPPLIGSLCLRSPARNNSPIVRNLMDWGETHLH